MTTYRAAEIGTIYQHDDRSLRDKYNQLGAPFFRIQISDQSERILFSAESAASDGNYDLNGLIVSDVEWDENDCEADMMSLTVQNPDLIIQDSRLFAEGNNIDLWMGYDGMQPDFMGRGSIVEMEPTFPSGTIPTIKVIAYDISYFMMEEGRTEIVPEGTSWWEQRRTAPQSTAGGNNSQTGNQGNATEASSETQTRTEQRQGTGPQSGAALTNTQFNNADPSRRPGAEQTEIRPGRQTTGTTSTQPARPRFQWRRVTQPRRRRRSGKVWRNMRDSEIVAAIFQSYGVVPYIEATSESRRSSITRVVTESLAGEPTEPSTGGQSGTNDTPGGGDRNATPALTQDNSDNAGPALTNDEVNARDPFARLGLNRLRIIEREIDPENNVMHTTVRGSRPRTVVQKSGTSDWEFIKKLAKQRGYIVFTFFDFSSRRWIGYWGPPNNVPQGKSYKFSYGQGDESTIESISPKISVRNQKTEIDLMYVDPRSNREQRLRVSMDQLSRYSPEFRGPDGNGTIDEPLGTGPQVTLTINGQRTQVLANRRFTDINDARRWLMAFWIRHAADFCTAEGKTIIGLPEMRARQVHEIIGIGRVSGGYFITKATHKMGAGQFYSVSFASYRIVDMIFSEAESESELVSVESHTLGEAPVDTN